MARGDQKIHSITSTFLVYFFSMSTAAALTPTITLLQRYTIITACISFAKNSIRIISSPQGVNILLLIEVVFVQLISLPDESE